MNRPPSPPRVRARRPRKPKPVGAIVAAALHEASASGYSRQQIATAMLETAGALVTAWDDAERRAVIEAMELQVSILRNGIDAAGLSKLRAMRAELAHGPAIFEARRARKDLEAFAWDSLEMRERQVFAKNLRDMARRLDPATNHELVYLR